MKMSKEKTPIEELIEEYEDILQSQAMRINKRECLESVIENLKELLPKEREAIEEAYYEGFYDSKHSVEFDNNYYKDKYGK